jgi:uncharacterized protein
MRVRSLSLAIEKLLKFAFVLCLLSQAACAQSNEPMRLPLDPTPMTVTTEKGQAAIKVEIARDPVERSRGLMFREKLPAGQGMLFVFDEPEILNFWMKNTPERLDIIYISAIGEIVSIQTGFPNSTDAIPSGGLAQFVLEMASGQAQSIGLKTGDKFVHPIIPSS